MADAKRDSNYVPTLLGVSSADGTTPVTLYADPTTHRLYVDLPTSSSGTVTSVSVTTANGVSGTVATATTTPAITLTLGAITPSTVNKVTITAPATGSTLTIADGKTLTANGNTTLGLSGITLDNSGGFIAAASKTLTVNNILTLSGTDSTTMTFPTTSKTLAANDGSNLTIASQAIGDLLVASSTTAYTRLAAVAVGQVLASNGTGAAPVYTANPQVTTIELGAATDTTISRVSAGVIAVEGKNVALNGTSETLTTGSIELGAASDTTIARVSAGVISVEGVTVPTISSTSTLTNKRINPRLVTATSYTTDTGTSLDVSTCDQFEITAQAGALKFNNPSGTPLGGQKLIIRIKDNGTARALTYDTQFRASSDLALPTTTVLSKTLYMGFVYNATDTKWDLLAVLNNF